MNKVILLGRLTKDIELRYTEPNNNAVARFTLAVNRKYAKQGEERQADFINIVAWGKLAETATTYLKKGMQIIVTGRIQTRTYTDNNQQIHYITEVICEDIDFVERKKMQENAENADMQETTQSETEEDTENVLNGDDLPF